MGYDLHITRRTEWHDEEQASIDISLQEWLSYIDKDKELELSHNYWTKVPGSATISQVSPGYCKAPNIGFLPLSCNLSRQPNTLILFLRSKIL
jgi:hypothetical protein